MIAAESSRRVRHREGSKCQVWNTGRPARGDEFGVWWLIENLGWQEEAEQYFWGGKGNGYRVWRNVIWSALGVLVILFFSDAEHKAPWEHPNRRTKTRLTKYMTQALSQIGIKVLPSMWSCQREHKAVELSDIPVFSDQLFSTVRNLEILIGLMCHGSSHC